jgi:hypothetical protein
LSATALPRTATDVGSGLVQAPQHPKYAIHSHERAQSEVISMPGENKTRVIVTISGTRPIHDVAGDLKAAGLEIDQILEVIGSVTGSAQRESIKRLRSVHGVVDVSEDHPTDIGPPGAPVS